MRGIRNLFSAVILVILVACAVSAQNTEFTYQGSLKDGVNLANGNYDFEFALFDALSAGVQVGSTLTRSSVAVSNGIFSVSLDFGNQFPGASRFLEIRVRPTGGGAFNTLSPLQQIDSAPYSVKSLNTDISTDAAQLGGVAASQYVVTTDPRMADARPPTAESADYIQNRTTPQAGDFNIAGNGIIGGNVGIGTLSPQQKLHVVSGTADIRLGSLTGFDGIQIHSSLGGHSPAISLAHSGNGGRQYRIASFGDNTNSGKFVIRDDTMGADRIQIDYWGKTVNIFGDPFGFSTGEPGASFSFNRVGTPNFLGVSVEQTNALNSFDGAGLINIGVNTGREGTFNAAYNGYWFRADSRPGSLGFHFFKKASSSGVESELFTIGDNGYVGIGTPAPHSRLDVRGGDVSIGLTSLPFALSFGNSLFVANDSGDALNTFRLDGAVNNLIIIANSTPGSTQPAGIIFRTAPAGGGENDRVSIDGDGNVRIEVLASAGSTSLCRNASNQISTCSSSIRYKQNINPFNQGLSLIKQLRPVSFNWRANNQADLGLVAEEVGAVEPLLTTTNDKGEVESVKYDRISVVLVNAVKEQQTQIETQQSKIGDQQSQIDFLKEQVKEQKVELDAFKALVCSQNPTAEVCRQKK